MAQKHLEEVIKASGLPEDQVKALVELPEETADFKAETYVAPIHTTIETKVKNDPKFYESLNKENLPKEFLQKLTAENYGASAATVRHHMLKAVGLSEKDFADLGEDFKKMEVFTPAFVKKLSDGKVTDKDLQKALMEANQKITDMEAALPETEKKYQTQYEAKMADFEFSNSVLTEIASVQGLTAPAKYLKDNIVAQLKSQYAFEMVNGVPELRQKDKPTLKVLIDNGTKELTLQGAIAKILEADGLVDKKKTTTSTTTTTTVNADKSGLKIHKGVNDKIEKRLAEDKKAAGE